MPFVNIDARGQRRNRAAVNEIQRRHGAAERKAAAEAKRIRKRAKRADPAAIVVYEMPKGGVSMVTPDGAYIQGSKGTGWQIIVIGEPKGPPETYRAAVAAWQRLEVKIVKAEPLPLPELRPGLVVDERAFLNIILEPVA